MTDAIEHFCDTLIIGSGAAGLTLALQVAQFSKVIVLSKANINDGSTFYAQGGIAAVFDKKDSIESHVSDTLIAGANLCDKSVVEMTAQNAKASLEWLIDCGADFDQELSSKGEQRYHLTKEGGHSHRRILHAADATGKEVQTTLQSQVLAHPNITVLERYNAVDLVTETKDNVKHVIGAYVWCRSREQVETIHAQHITLATGGASKVYQYTSNPDVASGDGIAMAWRAGCRVANLEFNQFHPTSLFHPQSNNFLLSEALRGEGAYLKRPDGSRFMDDFDARGELAPRDVVARAIDYEMKRLGVDCLYLDISHKNDEFITSHFPTIYQHCLSLGIDITKEPMPVVPAAHYTCGGVKTNKHGATDIKGLYAIGEVAYTGLHGANRMASNSLLECLVFAKTAADHIQADFKVPHSHTPIAPWDESKVTNSDEEVVIQHNWHELRLFMWDYVGIVRTNKRLARAKRRVELLQTEIDEYYSNFRVSNNLLELRNLVQVAQLIIDCAIARKESVGLHYNLDYPQASENSGPTVLGPR
ncbi:MAG: L-aspartate oxidase [Psychrobium sp.]